MFGPCKACLHKQQIIDLQTKSAEERLTLLNAHIDDLKKLIFNNQPVGHVSVLNAEADALLTAGVDETLSLTPEQARELEDIEREADRVLAGNY